MVSKKLTVVNAQGFHMRPASDFAKEMGSFTSEIILKHNGVDVNAKSLMNIMAACIKCGNELEVVCEGPDEEAALAKACEMIESGFGE